MMAKGMYVEFSYLSGLLDRIKLMKRRLAAIDEEFKDACRSLGPDVSADREIYLLINKLIAGLEFLDAGMDRQTDFLEEVPRLYESVEKGLIDSLPKMRIRIIQSGEIAETTLPLNEGMPSGLMGMAKTETDGYTASDRKIRPLSAGDRA